MRFLKVAFVTVVMLFVVGFFARTIYVAYPRPQKVSVLIDDHRTRIWEGYFHAACNYRFYLRKVDACPEKAAVYTDFAQQWKQLETRWADLRSNRDGWSASATLGRLHELEARRDDIEARELAEGYDHELMGEVQEDFEEFLGYDRETGEWE